jgi:hypothetical protein
MPKLTNGDYVSEPYSEVEIRASGVDEYTRERLIELSLDTLQGSTLICLTRRGVTQLRACLNEYQADLEELKGKQDAND